MLFPDIASWWLELWLRVSNVVFRGEDGSKECNEVFMRDFWKGVVVNDCALTGIPSVHDPCARHSETRPYFAVFCSYTR